MMCFRSLLFLSALAAAAGCGGSGTDGSALTANLFRTKRDDLPIVVRENAELQALRETIVRSEIEGQATIIFIVPEGTHVKQGDKLVELDVSELVEKAATQGITVAKADAALKQARKEKEILEKELLTNRRTAEAKLRVAEMLVEKLLGRATSQTSSEGKNGDMIKKLQALVQTPKADPVQLEAPADGSGAPVVATSQVDPAAYAGLVDKVHQLLRIEGDGTGAADRDMGEMANKILQQVDQIRLAMADLKVKEDTYAHSRRLAQKQFITRNELEKDQLAYQSQVSKVTLAWNDLDLLINYTLAKERIELTQDRDNAVLELERVRANNEALVIKADSDLDSRLKEFDLAKERLQNLERQIKSAVIVAPTPGTVVYARLDRNRGGGEAVREGVQVRERQEIILLPDTSKIRCVVKVQEAQVDKVARGQAATVTVEAFQGETFTGRVTSVAPVADSNSGWMTSDRKVYTTIVELDSDNPDGRLRSRMAANVTIMVDTVQDTLPVPLQAVFRDRYVNYAWRESADGPKAVAVKVGRQNGERVEILEGLAPGDVIHLTPPAGTTQPKFEQPVAPAPTVEQPVEKPPTTANAAPAPNQDGAGGGRRQGGGAAMRKKLAEMSATELDEYKASLERMQGMVDRVRDGGNADAAAELETTLASLRAALDKNDLDAGQQHQDKLRQLMRAAMNRGGANGGGGPGNGGGAGGGARSERGN